MMMKITNAQPREITEAELRQTSGGAAYLKIGDIRGDSRQAASCQNNLKQMALAFH